MRSMYISIIAICRFFIKKIEKKTNGYRVTCELTDSRIEDSDYKNTLLEKLKDKQNIIFNLVHD